MPTIYWVVPRLEEWCVERENLAHEEGIFDAREDAVDWACRVAAKRSPAIVRVTDAIGTVVQQYAFGTLEAPPPPRRLRAQIG